jgi:Porin PorA
MRGAVAVILKGLGVFLVAAAVIWPTYLVGQFIKIPAKEDVSSTLQATNATVFSPKTLSVQTGVTLRITATIKTDPKHPGNSSTDVWDQTAVVQEVTGNVTIATQTRVFAFNRRTTQLVPCCGESVNGDTSVKQTGYLGAFFPMNAQKQTYLVFDATLKRQMPYVYSGTAVVDGIMTYEFIESYGPTQSGTTPFIGSLVGSSQSLPTLPEYSSVHAVFDVDPVTGVPLKINEHETTSIRNPANGDSVTVIDADLVTPAAALASVVATDKSARAKLTLVKMTLPVAAALLGVAALIAGIILGRKPRVRPSLAGAGTGGFPVTPTRHRVIGRRYRGTRRRPRGARSRSGHSSPVSRPRPETIYR